MPIFEYKCSKCEAEFEELVPASDKNRKVACPECGSKSTEKQLSCFCVGKASAGSSAAAASCTTGTCPYA